MEWYIWLGIVFFLFLGVVFLVPVPTSDPLGAVVAWSLAFLIYLFGKTKKRWFDTIFRS